jgi:hypothetical protein
MDTSPFVLGLRQAARDFALAINVGIHVPALNGKLSNRSCWINEKGEVEVFYDKLHLFDYGTLKESNSVAAGKSIVPPFETAVSQVPSDTLFISYCFKSSGAFIPRSSFFSSRNSWMTLCFRAIYSYAFVV